MGLVCCGQGHLGCNLLLCPWEHATLQIKHVQIKQPVVNALQGNLKRKPQIVTKFNAMNGLEIRRGHTGKLLHASVHNTTINTARFST